MDETRDGFSEMDEARLRAFAAQADFVHRFQVTPDFAAGAAPRDSSSTPSNALLWPALSLIEGIALDDAVCLDLETRDGMLAFVVAAKGARHVDAFSSEQSDAFRIVRALRRFESVAYHPCVSALEATANFETARFDLVTAAGLLNSIDSPLLLLRQIRRLLKPGGLLVVDARLHEGAEAALFMPNEGDTAFVPTTAAARAMLKRAGFEVLVETRLLGRGASSAVDRDVLAVLARAVQPANATAAPADGEPASSKAVYRGTGGDSVINIWTHRATYPLSPPPDPMLKPPVPTLFTVGRESDFMSLVGKHPDGAFEWKDVYLLGVRYPGETMPEGMQWSLKQLGNLHILDHVRTLGLADVLEVGPGFNFYFCNHLPSWCSYTGLDAKGFYDQDVLSIANKARPTARMIDGLLGQGVPELANGSFDACISASVLEHVPSKDVADVCREMYRVLRPGGWSLHSIDLLETQLGEIGTRWLEELRSAGFEIEASGVDERFGGEVAADARGTYFHEPLSIRARFYAGYKADIWQPGGASYRAAAQMVSILVAARKPFEATVA